MNKPPTETAPTVAQLALKPGDTITYNGQRRVLKAVCEYNRTWRAWIGTHSPVALRLCHPVTGGES